MIATHVCWVECVNPTPTTLVNVGLSFALPSPIYVSTHLGIISKMKRKSLPAIPRAVRLEIKKTETIF
ncbi:hypothetical protein DP116_19875 [Brasilonema bromeliae SPC951]|uniref:Uncharacterized protein n=1 Tax=Brasilonema bromeliae SPC951 TaxID=385972 RepID=A0ABX1PAU5_9CYAN|nr:hypothetical protein [Brasilonema bromeliae SPC951]